MDLLFLLKSAAVLSLFFIVYKTLLKHENFFETNRLYLFTGLLVSFIIPLIQITNIEWIEAPKAQAAISVLPSITDHHTAVPVAEIPQEDFSVDWLQLLTVVYVVGVVFFALRFIMLLFSVRQQIRNGSTTEENGIQFINNSKNKSPFSFFNYIIYNKEQFSHQELETILTHEKAHCKQWHSIDIVLAQFTSIVLWFNPLVWKYQKAIQDNLEFLADQSTVNQNINTKDYQYLLIKTSVSSAQYCAITHHFNQSLIKKRIQMLNKQTNSKSYWKTLSILPALIVFIYSCNQKTETKFREVANKENEFTNIDSKEKYRDHLEQANDSVEINATKKSILNYLNIKPEPKTITQQNLNDWKDSKKYGLWIDGKKQENSVLKSYQPKDFSNFMVSIIHKNTIDYGKYTYHLNLETNSYFKERLRNWRPIIDRRSMTTFSAPILPRDLIRISSEYGMREHPILKKQKMHKGIDYLAPKGTPVYAASSGTIILSNKEGVYGNMINIKHSNGYETRYCHLHHMVVEKGDYVAIGQQIGTVGNTGAASGPHLHLEVLKDGKHVDPNIVIPSNTENNYPFILRKETSLKKLTSLEKKFNTLYDNKIQFSDIKYKDNQLISFTFSTKFKGKNKFTKCFSIKEENEMPIKNIAFTYISKEEEFTVVEQNGLQAHITAKRIICMPTNKNTSKEIMEKNPVSVVNDKVYTQKDLEKMNVDRIYTEESIEHLSPKEAVEKYGGIAKDDALIYHGKSKFIKKSKL